MPRDQILEEAKALNPKERELLAEDLWQTLDECTREEIADAWAIEIQRRLELLESGQMKTIPANEVFAKLQAKLKK